MCAKTDFVKFAKFTFFAKMETVYFRFNPATSKLIIEAYLKGLSHEMYRIWLLMTCMVSSRPK
jgi:hypothetical protein